MRRSNPTQMDRYRNIFLFILISVIGFSCKEAQEPDCKINILWNNEKQTIDGFGVAQAGWSDKLYAHFKREEVLQKMFGNEGLRLSILRGEVFPHYWENPQDKDFDLDADIDLPLTDSFFTGESDDLKRRGQLWIARYVKEKCKTDKLFFSVWSAPAYMKSNGKVSQGELNPAYNQAYADYLAAFYQAYKSVGLEPYAISPSNEPGYAAPWNSSLWTPEKMGEFIMEYLGPTFRKEEIPARIVFGENPFWSAVSQQAAFVSSRHFTDAIISQYPGITQYPVIAAGHGYTLPDSYPAPKDSLSTPIEPFGEAEKTDIPVWLTEISDTEALDTTIRDGIEWAITFHKYLSIANASACIWWAGALPAENNEGLIVLDPDRQNYLTTKRFYTFGNFSRYIPVGSKRIGTEISSAATDSLFFSAYKNGKDFTVVAINPTATGKRASLQIDGQVLSGKLNCFLTDEKNNWSSSETKGNQIEIPANSVVTVTGTIK